MDEPALKANIWIKAQIRICDANFIPIVVARRGDPDAGAILLKLNRMTEGVEVLSQVRIAEGERAWMRGTGNTPVDEEQADAYIDKQLNVDPDIWVLEIEDPDRRYQIDGKIV